MPQRGVEIWILLLLTLELGGSQRSAARSGRFSPRERTPASFIVGGFVGPTTDQVVLQNR
jgi:hypothetical protein